tara:strand:- start:227 stop:415 length:189 start_codon:yes stop_codon:yes gene_type:complete
MSGGNDISDPTVYIPVIIIVFFILLMTIFVCEIRRSVRENRDRDRQNINNKLLEEGRASEFN